jgi:pimeloyl-ACP methyl ester carboxylesterase
MTRNGRDFEAFAATLPELRVVCPDLRGRGASEPAPPHTYRHATYVDDVAELLAVTGVEQAVLVGASMGGMVAVLAAATLGDRIAGLVLDDVGPDAAAADPQRLAAFLRSPLTAPTWEDVAAKLEAAQGEDFPHFGPPDWLAAARRLCSERSDGTIRADYDPDLAVPFEAGWPETWDRWAVFESLGSRPMLLVRGARSRLLTRETVARMISVAPHLQVVEAPGVGHHPDLTEPVAQAGVRAFLGRLGWLA